MQVICKNIWRDMCMDDIPSNKFQQQRNKAGSPRGGQLAPGSQPTRAPKLANYLKIEQGLIKIDAIVNH